MVDIGRVSRRDVLKLAPLALGHTLFGCSTSQTAAVSETPEVRSVAHVVRAEARVDGAGVHLSRTLGGSALSVLDPFLLLDQIRSDRPADYERGFPTHPHRGFETVTYMIDGAMEHRDSVGNAGLLRGGSVQWMTAGHGIVHSEMPRQREGNLWGLQLWVNLPRASKMRSPRYQNIEPADVPEVSGGGADRVRVVAGTALGATGPVEGIMVAPTMLDITVPPGGRFQYELPRTDTAFALVLDGVAKLSDRGDLVPHGDLAVFGEGASVLVAADREPARVLLLSAAPLHEPIARRGPFVMTTEAELDQAWSDYRDGTLTRG